MNETVDEFTEDYQVTVTNIYSGKKQFRSGIIILHEIHLKMIAHQNVHIFLINRKQPSFKCECNANIGLMKLPKASMIVFLLLRAFRKGYQAS